LCALRRRRGADDAAQVQHVRRHRRRAVGGWRGDGGLLLRQHPLGEGQPGEDHLGDDPRAWGAGAVRRLEGTAQRNAGEDGMSAAPPPRLEVLPRDLGAYRAGNTGIPYVHRFDSGKPGPHVLVNALTHGNEFCGMVAATKLLDSGVRPKVGTLTVSFANVEAYEMFDVNDPLKSRLLVHNLNRI